jgi:hypothetical protein
MAATQPGEATNDTAGLAFLLAALALLRAGRWQRAPTALAALAAGLAIGCKLSLVVPVAALTVAVLAATPRGSRRALSLSWSVPLAVTGSYWYVRNLAATGNPLPWLHIGVGPFALPSPSFPVTRRAQFSVLHYATDGRVWHRFFLPGLRHAFGPAWPVVVLLPAAVLLAATAGKDRPLARLPAAVGLVALAAYLVIPTGAGGPEGTPFLFLYNLRYLAPALLVGAVLLPELSLSSTGRGQAIAAGVLTALLVSVETATGAVPAWPEAHPLALALGATALAFAAGAAWDTARRLPAPAWPSPKRAAWVRVAPATAALAVLAVGGGWWGQLAWVSGRWAGAAPPYAWARETRGARIALAGSYIQYPLYGTVLTNRVEYIGRREPHGGFRPTASCREWRLALQRGGYDFVVAVPNEADRRPPEAGWTRSDPAAHTLLDDGQSSVFRLEGPVHPDACP